MLIRPAAPRDVSTIVELAIEALGRNPYPELAISRDKVKTLAKECVSSPQHFSYVAEKDGAMVAACLALATPMMFYERYQASVLMCYSRDQNCALPLFRALMRWVKSRPIIKMVEYTMDRDADPRAAKLLRRLGYLESVPLYLYLR